MYDVQRAKTNSPGCRRRPVSTNIPGFLLVGHVLHWLMLSVCTTSSDAVILSRYMFLLHSHSSIYLSAKRDHSGGNATLSYLVIRGLARTKTNTVSPKCRVRDNSPLLSSQTRGIGHCSKGRVSNSNSPFTSPCFPLLYRRLLQPRRHAYTILREQTTAANQSP